MLFLAIIFLFYLLICFVLNNLEKVQCIIFNFIFIVDTITDVPIPPSCPLPFPSAAQFPAAITTLFSASMHCVCVFLASPFTLLIFNEGL